MRLNFFFFKGVEFCGLSTKLISQGIVSLKVLGIYVQDRRICLGSSWRILGRIRLTGEIERRSSILSQKETCYYTSPTDMAIKRKKTKLNPNRS